MSEASKPPQCSDEDWRLARDCGLMFAPPGTNEWDAALGRFAEAIRQKAMTKEIDHERQVDTLPALL